MSSYGRVVDDNEILRLFKETSEAVHGAISAVKDWRPMTDRPSQYAIDLVADKAALGVLIKSGVGVLSEESGLHKPLDPKLGLTVVVDPIDGSTNASRGIPWYATSLCALDDSGPRAAFVINQATGERFEALRGGGAQANGLAISSSSCSEFHQAIVGMSGMPDRHLGWRQFRVLGAAALDMCAVACGRLDAYFDTSNGIHGPWDYLGAMLICQEAGAVVGDSGGRELVVVEHEARRAPVAAATQELFEQLMSLIKPQRLKES